MPVFVVRWRSPAESYAVQLRLDFEPATERRHWWPAGRAVRIAVESRSIAQWNPINSACRFMQDSRWLGLRDYIGTQLPSGARSNRSTPAGESSSSKQAELKAATAALPD